MKAIITAAGKTQRHLPVQTMTDRDGFPTTTLRLQVNDFLSAGLDEIGMVINPGDERLYREVAGDLADHLTFIEQADARGYGHAVYCARDFAGDEPFVLTVSDHLYISNDLEKSCAGQVIEASKRLDGPVSAIHATHEREIQRFGTVGIARTGGVGNAYRIDQIVEKPSPTTAEQHLVVPGLRSGYYYCFFGIHVLPPDIFPLLEAELAGTPEARAVNLSNAHHALAQRQTCYAVTLDGERYDLEARHGLLLAQLALALKSRHREDLLVSLVNLLAK